jgi:hypothetical protein
MMTGSSVAVNPNLDPPEQLARPFPWLRYLAPEHRKEHIRQTVTLGKVNIQ